MPAAWVLDSLAPALTGKSSRYSYLRWKLTSSRVNMYASTWICTKNEDVVRPQAGRTISALSLPDSAVSSPKRSNSVEDLQI